VGAASATLASRLAPAPGATLAAAASGPAVAAAIGMAAGAAAMADFERFASATGLLA